MEKKRKFLKVEIIIIALNLILLMIKIKLDSRAFYAFILGIIIIILLCIKVRIENEKKEICLNICIGIIALILTVIKFNMGEIYFYLALIDGIHLKNVKIKILSSIITVSQYIVAIIILNLKFWQTGWWSNVSSSLMPYIGFTFFIVILHIRSKDKIRIRELNTELLEQNRKLKEYSQQVEILTLEKERNRVAQDLHDSLGHYLMAISMHLNILEKIKEEKKKEEIFKKTKELVKDSIKELRETVYKLKNETEKNFISRVEILEENFKEQIFFINNIDEKIEKETREVKEVLYRTIKEAITNGLKHGNSSEFKIEIIIKDKIFFTIDNNGISPKEIKMSNGLIGIKERIEKLNGKVLFEIKDRFTIKGEIDRSIND